jgi:preprotein translocase subunit SecF
MSSFSNLGNRLYSGEKSFNFVGRRNTWYVLSALLLVMSFAVLGIRGLNLGIEFKGGAEFAVPVSNPTTETVSIARSAVNQTGNTAANVTIVGGDKIRVQTQALSTSESTVVSTALANALGAAEQDVKIQLVGPTWGSEVSKNAARALIVFLILVAIFMAMYFEWSMAVAGLVALAHDVIITVGIYALSGFEVSPASVIGFLTILGYSLYDTVVVFDKVKENTKGITVGSRMTFSEAANLALNQTLVRSINTSLVAILPVLSILIVGVTQLGSGTLNDLALALFVGMVVGTFSSIFIATPFLAQIKERQPEMKALAKRVAIRREKDGDESVTEVKVSGSSVVHQSGPRQQIVKKPRSARKGR